VVKTLRRQLLKIVEHYRCYLYPSGTAGADILARTFPDITRLPMELESCSNPLKSKKSPVSSIKWNPSKFGFELVLGWYHEWVGSRVFGWRHQDLGKNFKRQILCFFFSNKLGKNSHV